MPKANQLLPAAKAPAPNVIHVNTKPSAASHGPAEDGATSCKVEDVLEEEIHYSDRARSVHIWALGVVCVMGGQLYGWNAAFATGFVPYAVSQVITGAAYVVYISSAAEVSGKIAFSGGSYGLTRITLGFYAGFLVGFLELLEYIASASVSVSYVAEFLATEFDIGEAYLPLMWFIFYIVFITIFHLRGKYVWSFMVVFALACIAPSVLLVVTNLHHADLGRYGGLVDNSTGSVVWASGTLSSAYFTWLPYTSWAYAGVECLTLVTSMTTDPKDTIPRGMVAATWTLFISNVALVFVVPALAPGIAECIDDEFPLNN
ncbi:Amino Acid-Polyamine-Organocation (APC) Family, partial [Achlya hypogyna]